jgi:hypothetical protein
LFLDHYNDVRECLSTLEEKIRNTKQPVPAQTFATVTGWIKIFRQAVEKWNQQHKSAHGDSHIIDWEDLDVRSSPWFCLLPCSDEGAPDY